MSTWTAHLLTIFPEMFPGPLGQSLAGRALENGLWSCAAHDIRTYATDRHRTVDDTPFGGGAGMVMRPDVLDAALTDVRAKAPAETPAIYLTPRGTPLTQARVQELAYGPGVILLCGRYEGVDQRVLDSHALEEISIGDYVLSGGEIAALTLLDACIRLRPGVMGNAETTHEESFEDGLLEYPHFTRPAEWQDGQGRTWPVPEILTGGHHGRIKEWRRQQAERITQQRRPDLWDRYSQTTPEDA